MLKKCAHSLPSLLTLNTQLLINYNVLVFEFQKNTRKTKNFMFNILSCTVTSLCYFHITFSLFFQEKVNTIFHCKVGNWRWNIESWHLKNQFNSTFSEQCKIGLFLSQNHFVYSGRIRYRGCQYFRVAQDKVCIPYKNKTFLLRHIFDDSSM